MSRGWVASAAVSGRGQQWAQRLGGGRPASRWMKAEKAHLRLRHFQQGHMGRGALRPAALGRDCGAWTLGAWVRVIQRGLRQIAQEGRGGRQRHGRHHCGVSRPTVHSRRYSMARKSHCPFDWPVAGQT